MFSGIIKNLTTGFFVGVANIIPGVSGGTFLLIFGIYEKTIRAVNSVVPTLTKEVLPSLAQLFGAARTKAFERIKKAILQSDMAFLIQILAGAGICIVLLSQLMKYLLESHRAPTYGLFFGFILVSTVVPFKLIQKKSAFLWVFALLGIAATVGVSASVNPYDKLIGKSHIYEQRLKNGAARSVQHEVGAESSRFALTGRYTPGEYVYGAICGAVAISAMVLPGISGSLVLILMGEYFEVIQAVAGLKGLELDYFLFLAAVALGMLVGILLFARLVEYTFKRFHDQTMTFLTGLIIGSLYALWPFKQVVFEDVYVKTDGAINLVKNMAIHTNKNVPPALSGELLVTCLTFLIGVGIMVSLLRFEPKE